MARWVPGLVLLLLCTLAAAAPAAQALLPGGPALEFRGGLPEGETKFRCTVNKDRIPPAFPGGASTAGGWGLASDCDLFLETEGFVQEMFYIARFRCRVQDTMPTPTGDGIECWIAAQVGEFLRVDERCSMQPWERVDCDGGVSSLGSTLLDQVVFVRAFCEVLLSAGIPPGLPTHGCGAAFGAEGHAAGVAYDVDGGCAEEQGAPTCDLAAALRQVRG